MLRPGDVPHLCQVTLLITVPLALAFLAPLGSYATAGLAAGVTWLFEVSGFNKQCDLGALIPVIVMFGMHTALQPLMLQNVQSIGYDYMLPLFFFQTLAMSGAAFAVFFKTRNVDLRGTSVGRYRSDFGYYRTCNVRRQPSLEEVFSLQL